MDIVKVGNENKMLAKEAKILFFNHEAGELNDKFFEDNRNIMVVGIINEKVIGMVYGYVLERFSSTHKQLFIYSIDVLSEYQGKGYGKRLLNEFLKPFFDYECNEAFVFTHMNNKKAVGLYTSCGAEIVKSSEGQNVLLEWSR